MDVVLKAVAPNPENRYQSCRDICRGVEKRRRDPDMRGSVGDEDDHDDLPPNNTGRILLLTIVMLLIIGAIGGGFVVTGD